MESLDDLFPRLLDDDGVLLPAERDTLERQLLADGAALRFWVFAQAAGASFPVSALDEHARRFLGAKVGLAVPKRGRSAAPTHDAARIVVLPPEGAAATVTLIARPVGDADRRRAEDAAFAAGGGNMDAVALRCKTVHELWCRPEEEAHALVLAAALAGTCLGPIVDAKAPAIFAVRTARERLEALRAHGYRGQA